MSTIALITWIAAAACGLYLVSIWLIEYDKEFQSAARTRLPPTVLASHVTLAVGGLVVWVAYLVNNSTSLVLISVLALLLAATLGTVMAVRWVKVYRETRALRLAAAEAASAAPDTAGEPGLDGAARAGLRGIATLSRGADLGPPERNFPLPVVIAHGAFAVTTLALVLVTLLIHGHS
jgi:hypothetical protein